MSASAIAYSSTEHVYYEWNILTVQYNLQDLGVVTVACTDKDQMTQSIVARMNRNTYSSGKACQQRE